MRVKTCERRRGGGVTSLEVLRWLSLEVDRLRSGKGRGDKGGGEDGRRMEALESPPEDLTVGYFILSLRTIPDSSSFFFFVPNPNGTPRTQSASYSCVPIDQISHYCHLTVVRPPRYLRMFHETVKLEGISKSL